MMTAIGSVTDETASRVPSGENDVLSAPGTPRSSCTISPVETRMMRTRPSPS